MIRTDPTPSPRPHLQVIYSLLRGGSERLACDIARGLDRTRHDPSVWALDHEGPLAGELAEAGIPSWVARRKDGVDWRLPVALVRKMRALRPAIVQTHHLNQLVYAAAAARVSGALLVHVEHETFTLRSPKQQRRLRRLSRFCHAVVGVADAVGDFLVGEVGIEPSRVTVIPNGVDLRRYRREPSVPRERFCKPEGRWIGHVARLEPEKDQATLLKAFRRVHERHPETRLVIAGDGRERSSLMRLAVTLGLVGVVEFLGVRADVAELLPHFEVFAFSSTKEGLPLAVLEAMACGKPVVATAVGEVPKLLAGDEGGLVAPVQDEVALAAAINRVLDDRDFAGKLGERGRAKIERRFDLAETIAAYEGLYRRLESGRADA